MGRSGRVSGWGWAVVLGSVVVVGGCWYTAPSGRRYLLRTDPETIELRVGAGVNFSNYVGYCLAEADVANDVGMREALELLEEKLDRHGYVKVKREELVSERGLLSNTFVVYFGYREYFEEGEVEVKLTLYDVAGEGGEGRPIWLWSSRVKEYPVSRANLVGVFRDIFDERPVGWGGDERLLPRRSAGEGTVKAFEEALERARAAVRLRNRG
ncbi:MAG: hypothetical protein N2595_07320 [bacterium]|nr:hypothetical protein [bacterium]